MLKLQYFGHLMQRTNSLEKTLIMGKFEGKRKRGWQRIRWLGSINHSMDMNLSKLWEIAENREAWWDTVLGVAKSQTRLSYWTRAKQILALVVPFPFAGASVSLLVKVKLMIPFQLLIYWLSSPNLSYLPSLWIWIQALFVFSPLPDGRMLNFAGRGR